VDWGFSESQTLRFTTPSGQSRCAVWGQPTWNMACVRTSPSPAAPWHGLFSLLLPQTEASWYRVHEEVTREGEHHPPHRQSRHDDPGGVSAVQKAGVCATSESLCLWPPNNKSCLFIIHHKPNTGSTSHTLTPVLKYFSVHITLYSCVCV